ncbi:UDP-N-acetylmuramate dehydrogenase [Pedobacter sp. ISL-68]|uniref:UDP-N-acetylmuramate dehydrogenase n=1 Tax=unclassified Pedobacter TaxID=2628915 RepID=UPI001BEC0DD2|nr:MULTISPECIES: UDP-N-acetylmuramate dehydrogenase [unclassified Pedobacter]MBT2560043.1 UDP-N-acetylmuramate dehydrogenase [Pedobacter sp. ISL-64]MBT2592347.1 UDP-N-acetylmuramate dehydrogenase [Pedobacter sp. ISL-68]
MLQIQENISLKPYNSFGIDVKASYFAEIFSEADLARLFKNEIVKSQKLLVIGGGSNVLFTQDYKGLVVKISIKGIQSRMIDDKVLVIAGAGEVWNDFVNYCVGHHFAGVENLSLIPGTVGASPIQNIGAYGVELKDVFQSCNAFEIKTGKIKTFTYDDCHFGYRESIFKGELKGRYIITSVTFRLSAEAKINTSYGAIETELLNRGIEKPDIADVSSAVSHIRVSKLPDPSTIGNAGSFFKNPVIEKYEFADIVAKHPDVVHYPTADDKIKLAAGWLIEQCGWKGRVIGQTGTWKNQALVLVNHGSATGTEVYNFSEQIIDSVKSTFGVTLEREVNIL